MRDVISSERLKALHPKFQPLIKGLIEDAENDLNLTIRIVQGMRTWEEQAVLYAQGRTTQGNIVTYSPAGASYHNYGIAADIVPFKTDNSGQLDWKFDFNKLRPYAVKYGIQMGLDFPHKDSDHFENKFGFNWRMLQHKYIMKDFIPNTEFVNI